MSFLFVWSFLIRCFRGMLLFLPKIFLIIFHTVLVRPIFDVKSFQVSRFDS